MINKKLISSFVFVWAIFAFVWFSMAQVSLNPIYSPDRFQPSDKFHAGCENQMDVVFDLDNANINWVNAILKYNSQDIDIIKIVAEWERENNLSYVIEDDKITFNKLKTDNGWLNDITFRLFFKWDESLKTTNFSFVDWSYVLDDKGNMQEINADYQFDFSNVPECNPDILPPRVELVFPVLKTGDFVALDSYFKFNIFDDGKWINKDSIKISIDNMMYDLSNIENERDGEILTIYPDIWLPLDSIVKLEILVWDKQVYGKSNIINKTYNLQTSKDLYLLNDIDPVQFRKLVNKEKYYQGSLGECDLLREIYSDMEELDQELLTSIAKRLSCDNINVVDKINDVDTLSGDDILDTKNNKIDYIIWENQHKISVLSVLWWSLFLFMFIIVWFMYLRKK